MAKHWLPGSFYIQLLETIFSHQACLCWPLNELHSYTDGQKVVGTAASLKRSPPEPTNSIID
jgi:hypothetical protein